MYLAFEDQDKYIMLFEIRLFDRLYFDGEEFGISMIFSSSELERKFAYHSSPSRVEEMILHFNFFFLVITPLFEDIVFQCGSSKTLG